ncbi:MAG TPA: C2 domain-containing protein [Polyangia bacterium]|nr:C2 domain-containing protein [Polyangia bacterium]
MRTTLKSTFTVLLAVLVAGLFATAIAAGCGSKKPKDKTAGDADAGPDAGSTDEEAVDEEQPAPEPTPTPTPEPTPEPLPPAKGPAVYPPEPANNHVNRQTRPYLVSLRKAQIIPGKASGECWDECDGKSQMALGTAMSNIGALPPNDPGKFDFAAKALQAGIGLVGGQGAFPDVFVHIRCGHGQGHVTQKNGAKDKMVASWSLENKTMQLDERDECVISVWDNDPDGDEEIGRATVKLVQLANAGGGTAKIHGAEIGFGLVYYLEIGVKAQDSGGGTTGGGTTTAPTPGASTYSVTVVKAEVKKTKKDGLPWDQALPMVGGANPDVFVNAWVNGYKSPQPFMTTAVKKENFWPSWDEGGAGYLGPNDHINFMVWDKDAAADDLIGECKTKPMKEQSLGEVWLKECGQVSYLLVRITKN